MFNTDQESVRIIHPHESTTVKKQSVIDAVTTELFGDKDHHSRSKVQNALTHNLKTVFGQRECDPNFRQKNERCVWFASGKQVREALTRWLKERIPTLRNLTVNKGPGGVDDGSQVVHKSSVSTVVVGAPLVGGQKKRASVAAVAEKNNSSGPSQGHSKSASTVRPSTTAIDGRVMPYSISSNQVATKKIVARGHNEASAGKSRIQKGRSLTALPDRQSKPSSASEKKSAVKQPKEVPVDVDGNGHQEVCRGLIEPPTPSESFGVAVVGEGNTINHAAGRSDVVKRTSAAGESRVGDGNATRLVYVPALFRKAQKGTLKRTTHDEEDESLRSEDESALKHPQSFQEKTGIATNVKRRNTNDAL